jgi:hypothetical protein
MNNPNEQIIIFFFPITLISVFFFVLSSTIYIDHINIQRYRKNPRYLRGEKYINIQHQFKIISAN